MRRFLYGITVAGVLLGLLTACNVTGQKDERPVLHGLWRSVNKGVSWQYESVVATDYLKTRKLPQINVYEFTRDPYVPGVIYGFTNFGLWRTIDQGVSWFPMNQGLRGTEQKIVNFLFFNPKNTNEMVATSSGDVFISRDGAEHWNKYNLELDTKVTVIGAFLNPQSTNEVYAVASDGSKKISYDGGETWSIGKWFSDEMKIAKIIKYRINPYNINEMYIVAEDGGIFRSLDRGDTWEKKSIVLVPSEGKKPETIAKITSIEFDYRNTPQRVFAGTTSGIYVSANGGATWDLFTKNLPIRQPNIYAIGYDVLAPQRVCFATARVSVFCTENNGKSWDSSEFVTDPDIPRALLMDSNSPSVMYIGVERTEAQ